MTHAEEVIALHNLARDPTVASREALRERVLANPATRAMHHHCFTTRSALGLLDHVGLQPAAVEVRWPHDIYVLAHLPRAAGADVDDDFRAQAAYTLRHSPFRVDRRADSETS